MDPRANQVEIALSVSLRRGIELLGEDAVASAVTRAVAFARRSRVGASLVLGMCVLAMTASLAACGEAPTPPNEAVQNYLNALGAGNYVNACGFLDTQARESLVRRAPARSTCAEIFSHCLPHKTIVLKQDQTQLLYANIEVTRAGADATALVSGTFVASELKRVTLRNEQTGWKLTGFGQAIERCRFIHHRHRRKATT